MPHDVKTIPASPQKGKVRENKHWQAGWWDFQPLAERSLRPLEWSQSSIIFCAHPVQPLITARHFSSSKQFIIPSPTQVAAVPTSFSPPTLISVAPSDDWLFAYFPGRNVEGISCLWSRGSQIDNWSIRESWSIAQGAGPVASKWLGQPREWVSGTTPGSTMRLPPLGPRTPVSGPTLLIVTQDHNINVCYYRQYMTSLKFLTCSIAQPAMSIEGQIAPGDSGSTIKQCTRAAIGVGYNGINFYSTIDPNLDPSTDSHSFEWENWGEDAVINLTEVQLLYNGQHLGRP
ncbi:hypothetical protein DXG01_017147 [Tephrocybe rancida]|nr:hypothetical protein DXG01_017147 [Tephrocybe rancida]